MRDLVNIVMHRTGGLVLVFVLGIGRISLHAQAEPPLPPQRNGTPVVDPDRPSAVEGTQSMLPHFSDTRFWLSGQANFIFQTHPEFPALYSGSHSLGPHYEKATSRVLTLYTGVRLDNSSEFLVDIEEAGGAALSLGFGLAGNTDLDIVRNPLSAEPFISGAACSTMSSP